MAVKRVSSLRSLLAAIAIGAGGAIAIKRYRRNLKGAEYNTNKRRLFAKFPDAVVAPLVVDIGAGSGVFTRMLRDRLNGRGARFVALDWSENDLRSALDCSFPVCSDLENGHIPLATECADVAMCDQVIEHLHDVEHALREINRVLKKDGVLLLSTPNLASWHNVAALFFGVHPNALSFEAGHIRAFTATSITSLLRDAGFSHVSVGGSGYVPWPTPIGEVLSIVDPGHALYLSVIARK